MEIYFGCLSKPKCFNEYSLEESGETDVSYRNQKLERVQVNCESCELLVTASCELYITASSELYIFL